MPYMPSRTRVAVLAAVLLAGCRIPGRDGPVPQTLTNSRRLSQQGVSALEHGEQSQAETLLAQAVKACPVDAEARRHYAEALWFRGARQEAIAQLEEAGRLAGEDAWIQSRLAEMRLATGEVELARQNAEQALTLDPKSPAAWAVRGGVSRAVGQPREALADYLRALAYAPNDRAILWGIAELHRELNQPERAIQTLQTLADTYSPGEEPGHVLYALGLAYAALGRYDDGVDSLAAAVTHGSPTAEMYCQLGEAQLLAGHSAEAAIAAHHALELQPQFEPGRQLLDRIQLAQRPPATMR